MISKTAKQGDSYHRPVLLEETVRYLVTRRNGIYLDLTCGGGGHLAGLSENLAAEARLLGVDRDPDAVKAAKERLKAVPQEVKFLNNTFARLDEIINSFGVDKVDGILLDLGVSSHQIDTPKRGFSFMTDGPLDMRMGPDAIRTAEDVINDYSETELARVFRDYGEERRYKPAVRAVVSARSKKRITTTGHLCDAIALALSPKYRNASLARIFQAIRIEVNGELSQLTEVLPKTIDCLLPGGRLVVLAYHSLEDRIVKRFLSEEAKGCICPPKMPICACGKKARVSILTRRVVRPSDEEMENNSRARSVRLRAAERMKDE